MSTTLTGDYTTPDAELFKTRHPEFTSVDNQKITFLIQECQTHVDTRWSKVDYQSAIMYLTAHLLTAEGEPERSNAIAAAGGTPVAGAGAGAEVRKVKVDDTEIEHFESGRRVNLNRSAALGNVGAADLDLMSTHYGRMYAQLRRKSHGGPRVFA